MDSWPDIAAPLVEHSLSVEVRSGHWSCNLVSDFHGVYPWRIK